MGLERELGSAHHLVSETIGYFGPDSTVLVDPDELALLALGPLGDLMALQGELAFQKLALGAHRHVFARRHREGAAYQARETCQANEARSGMSTGYAQYERHVGHEPVADSEDRSARPTALEVPMMVIVRLELSRRRVAAATDRSSVSLAAVAGERPQFSCGIHL